MKHNFENNNQQNEQSKFELPEGYFQKSASTIFNKIEWQEEHKEYQKLVNYKSSNGFTVPENYFLKSETKLELLEFKTLTSLKKNNSFKVPANYFEDAEALANRNLNPEFIEKSITDNDELSEFATLASLKKQNSFTVNQNYFAENSEKIKSQLTAKQAKVINLFSTKMWYSVAALLVIAISLWAYNSYFKIAEVKDCGTLACIDKIDLVKAKHLENIETEELYNLVNTKKLEDNLASASSSTTNIQNLDTSSNSSATNDLLDEL